MSILSNKVAIVTGLALELAPRRIRVNAIPPDHTETEGNVAAGTFEGDAGAVLAAKTPLGRLGRVTDIARWRCSWRPRNQPGSPGRSFVPQAVSLWLPERNVLTLQ